MFIANGAACNFGLFALHNIGKDTVISCELEAAAAFKASMRGYHQNQTETNHHRDCIHCHAWRSDATNASCWQNSKLQALQIRSVYTNVNNVRPDDFTSAKLWSTVCRDRDAWADTQRCSGGTGHAVHALTIKQLESVGCLAWKPWWPYIPLDQPFATQRRVFDAELAALSDPNNPRIQAADDKPFTAFCFTSDGGPDVTYQKKLLTVESSLTPNILFMGFACKMHSVALISKSGLLVLDRWLRSMGVSWTYYAGIAKLVHVWRDSARPMFKVWLDMFGPEEAIKCARKLPPKPISGRWGCISACENYLLKCDPESLRGVLHTVVAPKLIVGEDGPDGSEHANLSEPRADGQKEYRLRLGKWRRDSLSLVNEGLFWIVLELASRTRTPLDHLEHFMGSKVKNDDLLQFGNHHIQILTTKGAEIITEFGRILASSDWAQSIIDSSDYDISHELLRLEVELAGHHAATFYRRFLHPFERLQYNQTD
eukprot:12419184-Karenia_brevis.AAC.1